MVAVARQSFGAMLEEMSDRGLFQIERAIRESVSTPPGGPAVVIPLRPEPSVQGSDSAQHHEVSPDPFPGKRYALCVGDEDDRSLKVLGADPNTIFSRVRFWPRRRKVCGEAQASYLREHRAIPLGKSHYDLLWKDWCTRGDESVLERFHREMGLVTLDFYGCRYIKGIVSEQKYILSMVRRKRWCVKTWRMKDEWVRTCVPLNKKRLQAPLVA